MTTYWLVPSNPQKFDVKGAVEKFGGYVDWTKNRNIENDDIVYLYESSTSKAIIAKFIVIDNDVTENTRFKDEQFWKNGVKFNSKGYFRMELLSYFEKTLSLEWLRENGLKSNIQSVEKIKLELLEKIRLEEFSNRIAQFPDLSRSARDREFKQYNNEIISKIIKTYLFDGKSHRSIDEEILNLDSKQSKGYQSMGVLHYLGLVDNHKGIFSGMNIEEADFILQKANAMGVSSFFKRSKSTIIKKSDLDLKREIETIVRAKEGKKVQIYTYKYERNPKLREEAIRLHGVTCKVCGFNFEDFYGEVGKDFIEVHHTKPLHSYDEALEVDPLNDLVPVCSNCHRMIHRRKNNILSIEQLKSICDK